MTKSSKFAVNPQDLERVMGKLAAVLQAGMAENLAHGLFHAPASDHDALWLASSLLGKSEQFAVYHLTFYHQGMGEGTNTCAVVFKHKEMAEPEVR